MIAIIMLMKMAIASAVIVATAAHVIRILIVHHVAHLHMKMDMKTRMEIISKGIPATRAVTTKLILMVTVEPIHATPAIQLNVHHVNQQSPSESIS